MKSGIQLSIIIVNWNVKKLLHKCLKSIYREIHDKKTEVIVVDNNSNDGSVTMVRRNFPNVILIENNNNRGFAKAINQGIKVAKGKYILLLNSDTELVDSPISKLINFIKNKNEIACVAPKLLNSNLSLQLSCSKFFRFYRVKLHPPLKLFRKMPSIFKNFFYMYDYDRIQEIDYAAGAALLIPRWAFEKIGLFDENFFLYAEEADWSLRARKAGYKVIYYPEVKIIHHKDQSAKQVGFDILYNRHKSYCLYLVKHFSTSSFNFHRIKKLLQLIMQIFLSKSKAFLTKTNNSEEIDVYNKLLKLYSSEWTYAQFKKGEK